MMYAQNVRAAPDPGFWAGRRVLVTGHTGFKGCWLTLWLEALGAQVAGFSQDIPTDPSLYALARIGDGTRCINGDVRDAEAVSRAVAACEPEIVIHLAAQSLVRRSLVDPRGTYETNVIGTVNILEAVRQHSGVRIVVNVTSDKCYENQEWEWGYREHEPMGGRDPYASSKGCAELVTHAYRHSFFSSPDSARVATARAGNVIGGGDWATDRLVADIMRAALADQPVHVRNPASVRPWQHVLCPLSGYLVLAEALWDSPDHACGWNFGPPADDARPVSWIVEQITERWPSNLRWVHDEGPHPPEARYLKLDSSRARMRLGWRPAWGVDEALEAVVDWYRRLREQDDMRAVTLEQIEAYQRAPAPG